MKGGGEGLSFERCYNQLALAADSQLQEKTADKEKKILPVLVF